jgi:hypothetical protein
MADMQMDGTVKPTYNKRRKGYTFKMDDMEVFVKSDDENAAIKQMQELLEKEEKKEDSEKHSFADGGLLDEGGTVDPVSGNDVPPGSTQEEVRDDIPAQLSEGEFVFPADVVRYIGLENLMQIRQKAKEGLAKMDAMGQMGNSEEAIISDDGDYDAEIDAMIDELDMAQEFAYGGMVQEQPLYAQQGTFVPPVTPPAPSQLPTYEQFMGDRSSPVKYSSQQYIGPQGDIITITLINGKPVQNIPEGYRVYYPGSEAPTAPKVIKPEVEEDNGSGDGGNDEENKKDYKNFQTTISKLSELDPDFREQFEKTSELNKVQMAIAKGEKDPSAVDLMKTFGKSFGMPGAVVASLKGESAVTDSLRGLAEKYSVDIEPFQVLGILTNKLGLIDAIEKAKGTGVPKEEEGLTLEQKIARQTAKVKAASKAAEEAQQKVQKARDDLEAAQQTRDDAGDGRDDEQPGPEAPGISVDVVSAEEAEAMGIGEGSGPSSTGASTDTEGSFSKGGSVKRKNKKGLGRLR